MKFSNHLLKRTLVPAVISLSIFSCFSFAVTSQIVRHNSASDMLKGKTQKTTIDSEGTITLAKQSEEIDLQKSLESSWTINTIVESDDISEQALMDAS